MHLHHASSESAKGWFNGPWNGNLEITLGYANQGIDEPHVHLTKTEIYLVASGTSVLRIDESDIPLSRGDMLVVEPGEAHTFLRSSPDYFHFVIQVPGLPGDKKTVNPSLLGGAT